MKTLILLLISSLSAAATNSLITTATAGSIAIPSTAPYTAVSDTRVELRITDYTECNTVAPTAGLNFFRLRHSGGSTLLAFGCPAVTVAPEKSLAMWITATYTVATIAELGAHTDFIIRIQRDTTNFLIITEVWASSTGERLAYHSQSAGSSVAAPNVDMDSTEAQFLQASNGSMKIAWLRWYSGILPAGSYIPEDTTAVPGDLGNWEFESDLSGTGYGAAAMDITRGGAAPSFSLSPVHSPIVQGGVTNAIAGQTMTLDASRSFKFDGTDFSSANFTWQQTSGPNTAIVSDRRTEAPTVKGIAEGTYVFQLTAAGSTAVSVSAAVTNTDINSLPIYRTNYIAGTTPLSFSLASVPNATNVDVSVKKSDGRTLATVNCTASPCTLAVDNRQRDHLYQLTYKSAAAAVLARSSEWQPFPVTQVLPPAIYEASGGASFTRQGVYLPFTGDVNTNTAKYWGQLMYAGVNSYSSMPYYPNMPLHMNYNDSRLRYFFEIGEYNEIADLYGYKREDMWLHFFTDYELTYGQWTTVGVDKFDKFDTTWRRGTGISIVATGDSNTNVNGVLLCDAGATSCTDSTTAAYASTVAIAASKELLIAYTEPFDQMNFTFSVAGSGCTVAWYYPPTQGTWAALSVTDGTSGFSTAGKVSFLPPVGWARTTQSGGTRAKFWLRATQTCTTTQPTTSKIFADDWQIYSESIAVTSGAAATTITGTTVNVSPYTNGVRLRWVPGATCSGTVTMNLNGLGAKKVFAQGGFTGSYTSAVWVPPTTSAACTSGTPVFLLYVSTLDGGAGGYRISPLQRGWCNADALGSDRYSSTDLSWEYDPTPGTACSAKFRYQGRAPSKWQSNAGFTFNLIATHTNGDNIAARMMVDWVKSRFIVDGITHYNGIFLDDMYTHFANPGSMFYPVLYPQSLQVYTEQSSLVTSQAPYSSDRDSWEQEILMAFAGKVRDYMRADNPLYATFRVWSNAPFTTYIAARAEGRLHEIGMYPQKNYVLQTYHADQYMYDTVNIGSSGMNWHTEALGVNIYGDVSNMMHVFMDSYHIYQVPRDCDQSVGACTGGFAPWDRADRGPMTSWAMYLLAAQRGTIFKYTVDVGAVYAHGESYTYKEITPTTTTTAVINQSLTAGGGVKNVTVASTAGFTTTGTASYGDLGEFATYTVTSGTNLAFADTARMWGDPAQGDTYPIGTSVWLHKTRKPSEYAPPPLAQVINWGGSFPAQHIDVGIPDVAGLNAGVLDQAWASAAAAGTALPVMRRDYTKCIVLHTGTASATTTTLVSTPGNALALGGTYYRLSADGSTGAAITTIQLRSGEGVILMKQPVY